MLQLTYDDISYITKEGIIFKSPHRNTNILFSKCAENFSSENFSICANCVASRNINISIFIFYSNPKISIIFNKQNFINNIFSRRKEYKHFHELQKAICKMGYTTYDLS